jgi:hypothetical protein
MWKSTAEVEPTMVLNADQCRAKAADCLDAAKRSLYLDQRRLYEEIAEQWLLLAEQWDRRQTDATGQTPTSSAAMYHELRKRGTWEHGSATNGVK